eukprot:g7322.t1
MTIDPNNRKRRATRGYVHTHAGINPGYSALQQSYDEHGNPIDPNQPNPCNLHEVEVHADGNCLFRSVSDQMYLSEEYHELIRTKTMEYVKVEKDFFRDYIPNENFEAYVARKAKLGEWGDDLEIQALSEIYDCAVEIYDSEGRLQKTFHEFHGNGFQQHQPTGEMNDLMDSEYSWLEGVPIPQPVAGGGGSSSSSSRGPQHSDLRADLSGHLAPHMMSQHVPRSVIRLVYRGQSHYNSLRDMNRSRNLPQILQVREKFLRKLGYPQHAVPRNLPGAIEDLAIEYRRRNKNLNMEAAQQHRMEMEKRGGASLAGYPDAVLQCVSFGVPLEKALKAYEFAGADLDDMMLFLTTLS